MRNHVQETKEGGEDELMLLAHCSGNSHYDDAYIVVSASTEGRLH
jgi:hypothetical protein